MFIPHRGRHGARLGLAASPAAPNRPAARRRLGTDANRNWAPWHGYQVLAQGYRGKRAKAFARAVPQWEAPRTGAYWIVPAPVPLRYDRRTQTAVLT
jgi:hypothetical protein